jgi:hypothetical protein
MPDDTSIEQDLADAIAGVLGRHEHSMTTKFVAVIEVMDSAGDLALWTFTNEGARAWETKGMLLQALDEEIVATLRAED